jgi:septal ring factor EnvC (AmiA/AmiB activator)
LPPKLRRLYRQQYKVFEQSTSLISDSDRDSVFDAELKHLTDLDYLLSLAHAELSSSQPVSSPSKLTTSQLSSTSQITSVVLSDTEQQMGRTILKQLAHILRRRNTLSTDLEQSRNRVETLQTQLQDSLDLNAPFNSLSKVHQEEMLKLSQNRDSNFAALLNAFAHSNLHNDLSVLLLKEYQSALVGSESFTRVLQNGILPQL